MKRTLNTYRIVLSLCIASIYAPHVLAVGPDLSARSFIQLDFVQEYFGLIQDSLSYGAPTATAAGAWAVVGSSDLSFTAYEVSSCCTSYSFSVNPVIVTGPFNGNPYDTVYLYPPPLVDPDSVERFGASLSIQGFRIAAGSTEVLSEIIVLPFGGVWLSTDGGRVHLYGHNGTTFVHERTIIQGGIDDLFGYSLDLRRFALLVGSPGAIPGVADIFDPDTGNHITTFTSPGSGDNFGGTVALLDDLALVGASGSNTVYVYRHDGNGTWTAAGTLNSPGAGSEFGAAIDVLGDRILVGAPGLDRAYVFEDDGDAVWPVLEEIIGVTGSRFGTAVALSTDTAFVSAIVLPFNGGFSGWVGRYERLPDGSWPYVSHNMSRNPRDLDGFGSFLGASGALLAVTEKEKSWHRPMDKGELYIYSSQARIWDGDNDTFSDYGDNCIALYNPGQEDLDGDEIGDICDPDIDDDGLTNTEEDNLGSDPYDPDTDDDGLGDAQDPYPTNADGDGDGTNDPVDNCPLLSNPSQGNVDGDNEGDACDDNIDGDSLLNAEELTLGTDPYNPDTDGDLHVDGEDFLPLDFNDGWVQKRQFQVEVEQMLLGDDVLLVLEADERTLRSFAEVNGVWAEVPAPVLTGDPILELYRGGPEGNRFVAVDRGQGVVGTVFHLLEWSPSGGWNQYSPVDLSSVSVVNITNAVVGGDTLALRVYTAAASLATMVFEIGPAGPVFIDGTNLVSVSSSDYFGIAGDYLFSSEAGDDFVTAYDLLEGYSSQEITWPDPVQGARLGAGLYPVGQDKVFVDARNESFWMSLVNGTWSLELSGIEKWHHLTNHISGGDGSIVVHDLDPAEEGGFDLYRAHRVSDASEVGKFNDWDNGGSRIVTDGKVVIQARIGSYGSTHDVIDVFEIPPVLPPGC